MQRWEYKFVFIYNNRSLPPVRLADRYGGRSVSVDKSCNWGGSPQMYGKGEGDCGRSNCIFSVKVRLLVGVKIEGLNFSAVMQLL
jgi:hypothetical protein